MGRMFSGCYLARRMSLWPAMAEPISEPARILGERVRKCRQDQGLSQEALADRAGLHWTFVGQVERGQRNISLHNILKLANGLGIDPAELLKGLRAHG